MGFFAGVDLGKRKSQIKVITGVSPRNPLRLPRRPTGRSRRP
jgi:hypothetical protein